MRCAGGRHATPATTLLCSGIFIAGANEPTGWWSIVSHDNQWRHSNRYPFAIFKRTKYSYSFKSRRYCWLALPASCFTETRFSAIRIHSVGLLKRFGMRSEENGEKKSAYDYSKIRFPKTRKSCKKFETREIETTGYRKHFNSAFPSFFLCIWRIV